MKPILIVLWWRISAQQKQTRFNTPNWGYIASFWNAIQYIVQPSRKTFGLLSISQPTSQTQASGDSLVYIRLVDHSPGSTRRQSEHWEQGIDCIKYVYTQAGVTLSLSDDSNVLPCLNYYQFSALNIEYVCKNKSQRRIICDDWCKWVWIK